MNECQQPKCFACGVDRRQSTNIYPKDTYSEAVSARRAKTKSEMFAEEVEMRNKLALRK